LVGATPAAVFQFIASAPLGKRAFEGGIYSVLLGIGVHALISVVSAAGGFAVAALRWNWLRRHVVLGGCAADRGVSGHDFIVLPLSAIGLSLPRSPPCSPPACHSYVRIRRTHRGGVAQGS